MELNLNPFIHKENGCQKVTFLLVNKKCFTNSNTYKYTNDADYSIYLKQKRKFIYPKISNTYCNVFRHQFD